MMITDFVGRLGLALLAFTNVCVAVAAFDRLRKFGSNRPVLFIALGYGLGSVGTLLAILMHFGAFREPIRYGLWWSSTLLSFPTMILCTVGIVQIIRGIKAAPKDETKA